MITKDKIRRLKKRKRKGNSSDSWNKASKEQYTLEELKHADALHKETNLSLEVVLTLTKAAFRNNSKSSQLDNPTIETSTTYSRISHISVYVEDNKNLHDQK